MLTIRLFAALPTESTYQENWNASEPLLYLLLGIGFVLTLLVGGAFIYIMTRKND